jgi:hypothetical protein
MRWVRDFRIAAREAAFDRCLQGGQIGMGDAADRTLGLAEDLFEGHQPRRADGQEEEADMHSARALGRAVVSGDALGNVGRDVPGVNLRPILHHLFTRLRNRRWALESGDHGQIVLVSPRSTRSSS